MERPIGETVSAFVHGQFLNITKETETFKVINPSTGKPVAQVAEGGKTGIDKAIDKAAREKWESTTSQERASVLYDVANAIRQEKERLTNLRLKESGRRKSECEGNIETTANFFEYYAGLADKVQGKTVPVPGEREAKVVKEPLGITGHIIPWNAPLVLGARSLAPALAAGNTAVVKPAPEAPLSLLGLAEIIHETGVPAGVVNVVPGNGVETGTALTNDKRVRHITFTGSRETGTAVMKAAAERIVPVELELGGKNPSLVFPDADLATAADETVKVFRNAGQLCYSCARLFIHKDVYDEFLELVTERTKALTVGPGKDDSDVGPLISETARNRVSTLVDEAVENGAHLVAGGRRPERVGFFYEPTIIENVDSDHQIAQDEIFGPILVVDKFNSEDDAINKANNSEFGLHAAIWNNDISQAHRIANALDSGGVAINEYPIPFHELPFGGYKASGIGRQGGTQAIDHYTQQKSITINREK